MTHSIYKLQTGGAPPFVDYQYVPQAQLAAAPAAAASAKGKDEDIGIKDLLELASKMKGLPSDTNKLVETIQAMYRQASLFNNGKLSYDLLVKTYLGTLQQIKTAEYNQDLFDKAKQTCKENDGLYEAVINDDGQVLVHDGNIANMQFVSTDTYNANLDKLKIVTNANLLKIRAENKDLAFNNECLNVVANGIGFNKVTEYILKALSKIGETNTSQEGYIGTKNQLVIKGAELYQEAILKAKQLAEQDPNSVPGTIGELMTPEGLYKAKIITKDNYSQIKAAESYLWATLPENAKTFLKVKSGGTLENALLLMDSLMSANLSTNYQISADLQEKFDASGGRKSSGDSDDSGKMTAAMLWSVGKGYRETLTISDGTSYGIKIDANMTPLTNGSDKESLGLCTFDKVISSSFGGLLDFQNAYMGNLKIVAADNVAVMDGQIYSAYLPVNQLLARQGIYQPDFEFLKKIEAVEDELRASGVPESDVEAKNEAYRKAGLPIKYQRDTDGSVKLVNEGIYKRFAIFNGIGREEAFEPEDIEISPYLRELGSNDENLAGRFERILNANRSDKNKVSISVSGWGSDNVYQGLIFVPTKNNYLNAGVGSGIKFDESTIQSRDEAIRQNDKRNEILSNFLDYRQYTRHN